MSRGTACECFAFSSLLEQEVAGFIADALEDPYTVSVTAEPEPVELSAGRTLHVSLDTRSVGDEAARVHVYFLARGAEVYQVWCRRGPSTDDSWLSIAETFEFLPEEE